MALYGDLLDDNVDTFLSITTEIIESIRITLITETTKNTILLSKDDLITVYFIDDNATKSVSGRLVKFNKEALQVDCSSEYNSKVEIINIKSIRNIDKPTLLNNKVEPLNE